MTTVGSWRGLSLNLQFGGRHWAQPSEGLYSITVVFSSCAKNPLCSPRPENTLFPPVWLFLMNRKAVYLSSWPLCSAVSVYPAKSRALQGFGAGSFCMILDEVSGHRRRVGGTLLFCCARTKWAPRQKSIGKERMMTKIKRGGGKREVIPFHCVKWEGAGQPPGICGTLWCLGCPHKTGWMESQNTGILSNVSLVGRALLFPFQCPRSLKSESCYPLPPGCWESRLMGPWNRLARTSMHIFGLHSFDLNKARFLKVR